MSRVSLNGFQSRSDNFHHLVMATGNQLCETSAHIFLIVGDQNSHAFCAEAFVPTNRRFHTAQNRSRNHGNCFPERNFRSLPDANPPDCAVGVFTKQKAANSPVGFPVVPRAFGLPDLTRWINRKQVRTRRRQVLHRDFPPHAGSVRGPIPHCWRPDENVAGFTRVPGCRK
jgi:hypothetical protein